MVNTGVFTTTGNKVTSEKPPSRSALITPASWRESKRKAQQVLLNAAASSKASKSATVNKPKPSAGTAAKQSTSTSSELFSHCRS